MASQGKPGEQDTSERARRNAIREAMAEAPALPPSKRQALNVIYTHSDEGVTYPASTPETRAAREAMVQRLQRPEMDASLVARANFAAEVGDVFQLERLRGLQRRLEEGWSVRRVACAANRIAGNPFKKAHVEIVRRRREGAGMAAAIAARRAGHSRAPRCSGSRSSAKRGATRAGPGGSDPDPESSSDDDESGQPAFGGAASAFPSVSPGGGRPASFGSLHDLTPTLSGAQRLACFERLPVATQRRMLDGLRAFLAEERA